MKNKTAVIFCSGLLSGGIASLGLRKLYYKIRQHVKKFEDIYFEDEEDANDILDELKAALKQNQTITISDLCDILGVYIPSKYPPTKYGWKDLSKARIVKNRFGYTIKFPKVKRV